MVDLQLLALHGLAVKSAATPEAVATLIGQSPEDVQQALESAVGEGHAIGAKGRFMVTPGGRAWLGENYPQAFAAHRDDPGFTTAADKFERINRDLLALLTDWQSMPAGGERVPNTHTDPDYDRAILDRLGDLHDRAAKVLHRLTTVEPRLEAYVGRLDAACEGLVVGGVRVDSYHVAWHELHEDLLRMLGRTREE